MSNEQRAHDLTMLYVETFVNFEYKNAISKAKDNQVNFNLDFYAKYKEFYPIVLEQINRDFPQN